MRKQQGQEGRGWGGTRGKVGGGSSSDAAGSRRRFHGDSCIYPSQCIRVIYPSRGIIRVSVSVFPSRCIRVGAAESVHARVSALRPFVRPRTCASTRTCTATTTYQIPHP